MAFISLRKQAQPVDAEVLEDQAAEQEQPDSQEEQAEPGIVRGLALGVRGWWAWTSGLIGARGAYTSHAIALWAAVHYGGWVRLGVAVVLVVGPALFIPAEITARLAARIERGRTTPGEQGTPPAAEACADPLVTVLWTLIGDAPGVHLKTLTETLAQGAEKDGLPVPSRADVQASLEARGIALRPSVRDARGAVNRGVHREDLTAALQAPSPPETAAPAPSP